MTTDNLQKIAATSDEVQRAKIYSRQFLKLEGDLFAQFEWSKQAAILGVRDAIHYVVAAYQAGNGVEPDQTKAFEWMSRAASKLHFESFYFDLALAYLDGIGTVRDIEKFWEWMTKAAETQDTEAMFQLADAHQKPELGRMSVERSAEWTSKMAEAGAPGAMIQLAGLYRDGVGVEKDPQSMMKWAKRAVDKAASLWAASKKINAKKDDNSWTYEDYPDALSMLAQAYEQKKEHTEAQKLYKKAALAASEAMNVAIAKKDEAGRRLALIMIKLLPQFKTKRGDVRSAYRGRYLMWLKNVDRAIQYIYFTEDGANTLPPALVQAIFELAIAYRDGVGTAKDKLESARQLERAAKAGHGEAAFLVAMNRRKEGDQLAFNQFIEIAAEANHAGAQIAQAMSAACDLDSGKFSSVLQSLRLLRSTVDTIREQRHALKIGDAEAGIAHYTDGAALASMLEGDSSCERNRIRLYSIAYVNDPKEGMRLRNFKDNSFNNPLTQLFKNDGGTQEAISWQGKDFLVFVACFSLQCDSLNLWRFYGRNGTGYSVVSPHAAFDATSTQGVLRGAWTKQTTLVPEVTLYKVLYDDKSAKDALTDLSAPLKSLSRLIKRLGSIAEEKLRPIAAAIVSELLYLYKDKDYENEKEVRAVQARTFGDSELKQHTLPGNPFAKLYVETRSVLFQHLGSAIIVGPKVENASATIIDIQHRLARHKWSVCEVKQSKVPYR